MKDDDLLAIAGRSRALDISDEERAERRLAERLAEAGVRGTAGQRAGGQKRARERQTQQAIRRIMVEFWLFDPASDIPERLRSTPSGAAAVEALMKRLACAGLGAGERTVRADIAAINRQRGVPKSMQ
ncbi:hypothetical protein [Bosea sp. NBC_00550]|uniref:hypothetical protein n=1 Tax=Bosea sp. NBC_00550 TaxID=2969621 RepID=UPI002230312F|nr:hypothetical protein [Bosea sp. NBC_00550]UZF93733.1 hypothetical protein NWE53_05940 [Bosea sp. NBC_00550]